MAVRNPQQSGGEKIRALVVDNDPRVAQLIAMTLRYEGWDVETAGTGAEALEKIRAHAPDVSVFDTGLPDLDGMEFLSTVRAAGDMFPVLFLSSPESEEERLNGLTSGGDDAMVKPFAPEELVARLRGLVRRAQVSKASHPGLHDPVLRVGDLTLNEDSYEVERSGRPIPVTNTEFELLRYLMRNPGRVLSKTQVLDRVWAYDFTGKSTVVELYVSYLRKKIDSDFDPMLHTVRGAGYILKPVS
ncbi:response regulator transcription factor [Leucobacter insecticola]|uniref:Response regulator transcription factor n=1 Tax=Leucobacter insecticola TaxID=2714934 RepID=A0A6G8FKU8_9MICO|nr:response regulator transcription factor [Leucobacter insecticola]QIM17110.1 response regulator transcription factor [Leucobacter insecticola]